MSIKKNLRMIPLVLLLAVALPASSAVIMPESPINNSHAKTENPRVQELLQRLGEIKDMDKSGLTGSEKKDLRKEVRGIKKEMKGISGGVYLSVGAIIIIILLLILLL
jgi:hypothetical protein